MLRYHTQIMSCPNEISEISITLLATIATYAISTAETISDTQNLRIHTDTI